MELTYDLQNSRTFWTQQYRSLETQSEQIVRTALEILQNLLTTS